MASRYFISPDRPAIRIPALAWLGVLPMVFGTPATADVSAGPADLVLTDGAVYTGEPRQPWAQAIAIKGDRIVFVGSDRDAGDFVRGARTVDLHGAFVMPGMIDAHTHPGSVATRGSEDAKADAKLTIPPGTKAEQLAYLGRYAASHPSQSPIMLRGWQVINFLPKGPDKRDLDAIWPKTPVLLSDDSGHSYWANSAMLRQLGITRDTKDLTPGVSVVMRDGMGEPTGWLKEFVIARQLASLRNRPDAEIRARIKAHLDFMAANGITALMDAGNVGMEDPIYRAVSSLDKAGELPLRYFATYHIWDPKQLDEAIARVRQLQAKYGSDRLVINTVKIHYDGVSEIGTSGQDAPFANDPTSRGGDIVDSDRLARFIVALDAAGLNLHLHTIGDRASNDALDAVEKARRQLGRPLRIMISLAHLETMRPENFARFKALDVTANYSPIWFGWIKDNALTPLYLGQARASHTYQMGSMVRAGANVSTGSDQVEKSESQELVPLRGLQSAVTRKDFDQGDGLKGANQPEERLTVAQAIRAETLGGAVQVGYGKQLGTLAVGKLADLVILGGDPFKVAPRDIHTLKVASVLVGGKLVAGSLAR